MEDENLRKHIIAFDTRTPYIRISDLTSVLFIRTLISFVNFSISTMIHAFLLSALIIMRERTSTKYNRQSHSNEIGNEC